MSKFLFLIMLIAQTCAFAHGIQHEIPLNLQLQLAQVKLTKAQLREIKGPEKNNKDLIVPTLGMAIGTVLIIGSLLDILPRRKVDQCNASILGIGALTFGISYNAFVSGNKKECDCLSQDVQAKEALVKHLREQVTKAKRIGA